MKTFKVIEEGRILTADELVKVEGGICPTANWYRDCSGGVNKTTCLPLAPCAMDVTCSGFFRTCPVGAEYKFTCPVPFTTQACGESAGPYVITEIGRL